MEATPLPRMSRPLPRRKLEATPLPRVWLSSSCNLFGDLLGYLRLWMLMMMEIAGPLRLGLERSVDGLYLRVFFVVSLLTCGLYLSIFLASAVSCGLRNTP